MNKYVFEISAQIVETSHGRAEIIGKFQRLRADQVVCLVFEMQFCCMNCHLTQSEKFQSLLKADI